jgi:hypothetical protein
LAQDADPARPGMPIALQVATPDMPHSMILRFSLPGLVALAACADVVEPRDLGEPFAAPAVWREYYQDVWNRCGSTLRGQPAYPYGELEFRVVAGESISWDGKLALGAWEGNRIYLAEAVLDVPLVVRHEMLHAQAGQPGHPAIFATCDSLAVGPTGYSGSQ